MNSVFIYLIKHSSHGALWHEMLRFAQHDKAVIIGSIAATELINCGILFQLPDNSGCCRTE